MGVDDALALAVATRLPGVRVVALSTVFGNVPLDTATRNARLLRALLAPALDVPVLRGAERAAHAPPADARAVHGDDGLGGATAGLPADMMQAAAKPARFDADLAAAIADGPPRWLRPGERVILLGLGPATNLPALAAWYGPALAGIVLMAGVFFDRGNITDVAEFNAYCDPDALAATAALSVPVSIVPLDLCRKVVLTRETIAAWPATEATGLMRFLAAAHAHYIGVYRSAEAIDGCFPHDTIALLAACRPEIFFPVPGTIAVARDGDLRGRTRLDPAGPTSVLTGGDLAWVRRGLATLRFQQA